MSVRTFSAEIGRYRIGVIGEDPPDDAKAVLESVGYDLYRFDLASLDDRGALASTVAVVYRQEPTEPTKPSKLLEVLQNYAPRLLWNDCRVFVVPVRAEPGAHGARWRSLVVNAIDSLRLPSTGLSDDEQQRLKEWRLPGEQQQTPFVHVVSDPDVWREIAVVLRDHPCDRPPNHDLQVDIMAGDGHPTGALLPAEQDLLVRRAFADCASLRLVPVSNGLSGIETFRAFAHARNRDGAVGGKQPFLYFVKLGKRTTVAKEITAYQQGSMQHLPYHLGPRLVLDRCALGHQEGVLVSDYVSGAETLRDCARDGRGVSAIANLLSATVRAWRSNATREDKSSTLRDFLLGKLDLPIPDHRSARIESVASKGSRGHLKGMVTELGPQSVLVGVIHGDLHATNVLVRGDDAILIDFEKVELSAPILWDLASLEGGLFVDGFIGDRRSAEDIVASIAQLYSAAALEHADVAGCHPSDPSAWYSDCVRQIRLHVRPIELAPRQFAMALAVALMRKACNPDSLGICSVHARGMCRECVRALAFRLSELIVSNLKAAGDEPKAAGT